MDKIEKIGREIREFFALRKLTAFRKWFHDFDAEAGTGNLRRTFR